MKGYEYKSPGYPYAMPGFAYPKPYPSIWPLACCAGAISSKKAKARVHNVLRRRAIWRFMGILRRRREGEASNGHSTQAVNLDYRRAEPRSANAKIAVPAPRTPEFWR